MSAIFGFLNKSLNPLPENILDRMAGALSYRGPDGTKIWQENSIGLGICILKFSTESNNYPQIVTDTMDNFVITADARIDNRREIASALNISNKRLDKTSDNLLIIEAYKKWGNHCFARLLGDFAIAIFDKKKNSLICARDALGIKPFYYHDNRKAFLFASDLKALISTNLISKKVNEGAVAEHLTFRLCSKSETLFSDIQRLPPAHYMVICPERAVILPYWSINQHKKIRFKNDFEYSEHFNELLREAIKCRLKDVDRVGSELSGGLDSSTVTIHANNILKEQNKRYLTAYSLTYPELACDEKSYIESVIDKYDIPINYLSFTNYLQPQWVEQIERTYNLPEMPNLSMTDPLTSLAQKQGVRVLLSGIGGDEWFNGSGFPYLDFLKDRQIELFIKEFKREISIGFSDALMHILKNLSWPVIPAPIKKAAFSARFFKQLPKWISPSFIKKTNLFDRVFQADSRFQLSNLGNCWPASVFTMGTEDFILEGLDKHRASFHIENRYPLLDKRIAEFSMGLPDYQRQRAGLIKYILRCNQSSLLPSHIRNRKGKAEFSYFFGQAFNSVKFKNNITNLSINDLGWISPAKYREELFDIQKLFKTQQNGPHGGIFPLWMLFSINMWYRTIK